MTLFDALTVALATWRVSSLFTQEDGPYNIFGRLRERTTLGGALECLWCASVWVAGAVLLVWHVWRWPVRVLAASAAAIAIDRHNGG